MSKNISVNQLNEKIIRLVALQVIIITVVVMATNLVFLAVLLAIDFSLRAYTKIKSPLAFIAKKVSDSLKLTPKPIFAPPKRFAASLGFIFSVLIAIFLYFNFSVAAYITGAILLFCAIMESAFNICFGCYVYNWLVVPFNKMRKV